MIIFIIYPPNNTLVNKVITDYKNATYIINDAQVTLINGQAEDAVVPQSGSKTITKYFGNEAVGDLNGDGQADVAFILTQDSGGSGTFYYVVAALKTAGGYQGTNAVILGDRISPQTTEIKDGQIIVNYADRKPDEPFSAIPSVGISKYLKVENNKLIIVNNLIHVSYPKPNDKIVSPLVVTGEARGGWFFEGSFPVILTDWDGKIIAQGIAQAQGEWMTANFVPFTVSLDFTKPSYGTTGSLILKKDNPSDLRQFDDSIEIPVKF